MDGAVVSCIVWDTDTRYVVYVDYAYVRKEDLDPPELLLVLQTQYQPHYFLEVLALETRIVSLQTIQF